MTSEHSSPAHEAVSSPRRYGPDVTRPRRRLAAWAAALGIVLLTALAVWQSQGYPGCFNCCWPDCSGGRGCGVYQEGVDANGYIWSNCKAPDYPAAYFGGECQTCPADEVPPGSNGDWTDVATTWGSGGKGAGSGFGMQLDNAATTWRCRSCGGGAGGGGGPSGFCGMAVWWVSEPGLTIWFKDTPLQYQPSHGRPVQFTLFCRDTYPGDMNYEVVSGAVATLGQHWSSPWLCYVKQSGGEWALYTGAGGSCKVNRVSGQTRG